MSNPRKQLGTALENRVVQKAKDVGLEASKQPLSGVLKDFPSDVVVEKGLVECKVRGVEIDARGQRYIRLDLDWLPKVEKEADRMGFEWAAVVVNPKCSKYPYIITSLGFFLELLKERVEKS